jgi:hypothetical protein
MSSTCVADTKANQLCTGLPSSASWNTSSAITQTWNGTGWIPETAGTYNEAASTTECRYKCKENYGWNGIICISASICTGQTLCYNATTTTICPSTGSYYGQDSQYLNKCFPRSYTVFGTNPQEIVTDNNTGLQWQRTIPTSSYTWENAINYCEGLSYGGYSDWRLPARKELATLPNYGRYSPAIDIDAFPETPSSGFWSSFSTVSYTPPSYAWLVFFDKGFVSYDFKTDIYYVRCVRGEEWNPESTFEEVKVSGKVIVKDSETGLEWTKEYVSDKTWQQALDYCETLNYGGHADWRIPNINELKTLFDDTRYNPASNFPAMPSRYFWSSSSYVGNAGNAWCLYFFYGGPHNVGKSNTLDARCVR